MKRHVESAGFDPVRSFTAFGPFLRYLRRRARLTQRDLSVAVGYSPGQISLLENGQRLPDLTTVAALFVAALDLEERPNLVTHLLALAAGARGQAASLTLTRTTRRLVAEELIEIEPEPQPRRSLTPSFALPAPLLPILAREHEIAAVRALLLDPAVRLVSLLGPPGVGKTRLALQTAWETQSAFAGGACFVELAAVDDVGLVAGTLLQALGASRAAGEPGTDLVALQAILRDREMLLVLDNLEQLLAAAPLIAGLLAGAPRLKALTTSRTALRLYGEHEFPVPPLALPDLARLPHLDELAAVPSIALFMARARAVNPSLELTPANALAVASICVRLDGLPLAIELAAAQCRLFAPQELAARLVRGTARAHAAPGALPLLTRGARNLPARQQTLYAAVDWSFRLLDPVEQALFARLGIFSGGFDLAAVEGCGVEGSAASVDSPFDLQPFDKLGAGSSTIEALNLLVDHSLVQFVAGEEARFTLLEMLREYALERLAARGELDEMGRRHAEYFTTLAEEALPHLFETEQERWLARLQREQDNLRAALRWACEMGSVRIGLRLGAALWWFWYRQATLTEGRAWLDELLALPWSESGADQEILVLRAKALNGAGSMAAEQRDYASAERYHSEALRLRRSAGDMRGLGVTLHNLALVARERRDFARALALLEESLEIDRQAANAHDLALSLINVGLTAAEMQDHVRAERWLDEGIAMAAASGDPWCLGFGLQSLSDLKFAQGAYVQAGDLAREGLSLFTRHGDALYRVDALKRLGQVAAKQGQLVEARATLEEALALAEEIGDEHRAAECRRLLAREP